MYRSAMKSILYLMALLGALIPLGGCGESQSSVDSRAKVAPAVRISVVEVKPRVVKDILVLPGETEARHDVTLAAKRDGQVEWIGPTEGQTVKLGELMIKVDVEALKATLERWEAAYQMSKDVASRRLSLHRGAILAKEEMEKAITDRTRALSSLKEARVNYEQGFVRSPIEGVVNKLHVDPGEFVKRGQPVAELVHVDVIRINVNVPELDVRYLKVGQKARVTVDAYPGDHWDGEVDFVAFKADPATKTFKVRVVVDNKDRRIRPGMIAHVAFLRRLIPDALTAPLFAILDRGGERIIFIEKDGTAHARTVSIGVIDGAAAQITKGLNPGENLIVTGQHDVEDGMRVSTK